MRPLPRLLCGLACCGMAGAARAGGPQLDAQPVAMMASGAEGAIWRDRPEPGSGPRDNHYAGNFLIVAAGVALVPEFDGARGHRAVAAVGVMGKLGPVSFSPRAAGLALNLVPVRPGQRLVFSAGPVARYQTNRHGHISDPVVAALGTLPGTVEAGINASIAYHGLVTGADALSLGADVRWDVSGHGAGRIVSASLSYYTPLSRGVLVAGSGFVDIVDDRYAAFNYAVDAAGSAASGLPVYRAHGGVKDLGLRGVLVIDFDGDLLDGGGALLAGVNWSRLQGSAAETPITRLRGQRSQVVYGAGLGWSF